MAIGNNDSLACDLLILVATSTEEKKLGEVTTKLDIPFLRKKTREPVGRYWSLGQVGDMRVNAVRCKMGSLAYGGSASKALLCLQAMGATSMVQLGMAFGVDDKKQEFGDVLVSTAILPYDMRDVLTSEDGSGYRNSYGRVKREPAKASLVNLFRQSEQIRQDWGFNVHFGDVLSGAAVISSRHYIKELIDNVPKADEPIVGGEMEAVGLLSVSERPLWIVIKGISDFADDRRREYIAKTRLDACYNSALFTLQCLLDHGLTHPIVHEAPSHE